MTKKIHDKAVMVANMGWVGGLA